MQPAQPEQGPQVTPPEYDKGDFIGITMPGAGEVGFGKNNDGYLGDEYKPEEPPTEMPEAIVPPSTPPEGPKDFDTSLYEDELDLPDDPNDDSGEFADLRQADDEARNERLIDAADASVAGGDANIDAGYAIADKVSLFSEDPTLNDGGDHSSDVLRSDIEPVEDSE